MDKQQAINEKRKSYYIPLEVTEGTVITPEYDNAPVYGFKIGNRRVRVILIPASKDVYDAYMRPEWREDKRKQRHASQESSLEEIRDIYELEPADDVNLEDIVIKEELLKVLRRELDQLKEIDHIILDMFSQGYSESKIASAVGLSQKGVNKRKHRVLDYLYKRMKDYR